MYDLHPRHEASNTHVVVAVLQMGQQSFSQNQSNGYGRNVNGMGKLVVLNIYEQ